MDHNSLGSSIDTDVYRLHEAFDEDELVKFEYFGEDLKELKVCRSDSNRYSKIHAILVSLIDQIDDDHLIPSDDFYVISDFFNGKYMGSNPKADIDIAHQAISVFLEIMNHSDDAIDYFVENDMLNAVFDAFGTEISFFNTGHIWCLLSFLIQKKFYRYVVECKINIVFIDSLVHNENFEPVPEFVDYLSFLVRSFDPKNELYARVYNIQVALFPRIRNSLLNNLIVAYIKLSETLLRAEKVDHLLLIDLNDMYFGTFSTDVKIALANYVATLSTHRIYYDRLDIARLISDLYEGVNDDLIDCISTMLVGLLDDRRFWNKLHVNDYIQALREKFYNASLAIKSSIVSVQSAYIYNFNVEFIDSFDMTILDDVCDFLRIERVTADTYLALKSVLSFMRISETTHRAEEIREYVRHRLLDETINFYAGYSRLYNDDFPIQYVAQEILARL